MRHLLVITLVLLAVTGLGECFLVEKSAQTKEQSDNRVKRSLTSPLFKFPAHNAVFHAVKAAERIREKRSVADAAQNVNKQTVNNVMEKIKNVQKRSASLTGLKSGIPPPPGVSDRR